MSFDSHLTWLLEGDVAIQYQVYRDLLGTERQDLRERIASEGWGAEFLSRQKANGYWGNGFYNPNWISSHYTLLDLRNLEISPDNTLVQDSISKILNDCKSDDGGIYPKSKKSDVCVNGMFLNYASYFRAAEDQLKSVIDCLLREIMHDGGFNCRSNRSSVAVHSSLHSTLSVLEGITEYRYNGYSYRLDELKKVEHSAQEFILLHKVYLSDRTGKIIDHRFLRFPYPCRWRYDILRALGYFQYAVSPWDERMLPAIKILLEKRNKDGLWKVQAKYPGQIHFEMEKAGQISRWNTLRALRVLKQYNTALATLDLQD